MEVTDLAETKLRPHNTVVRNSRGKELARTSYLELYEEIREVAIANATIRFDARIEGMQDDKDKVQVMLDGGEFLEADLLIGADGLMSTVRKAYWGEHEKCTEGLGYYYATYEVEMANGLPDYCQTYNTTGHFDVLFAPAKARVAALHVWRADLFGHPKADDKKYNVIRAAVAEKKNPT